VPKLALGVWYNPLGLSLAFGPARAGGAATRASAKACSVYLPVYDAYGDYLGLLLVDGCEQ
jgi:hypothetical protein